MQSTCMPRASSPHSDPIAPVPKNATTLAAVQSAFKMFEQQSAQLEKAYRALEEDLASSNQALQERNTELTAKNQELRQVSSRLESVVESLTDGLLVIGRNGRIERCNSAACRMLQTERDHTHQAQFTALVPAPNVDTHLKRVLKGDPPVLDAPWQIHQPHETRHILLSLAPVTASDGNILGAICNLRDVTDFRRMEKRLQSQERLAALGEMAASVAHEIRNPLGTIEGFARLLRRDLASMPAPLKLAERIVAGAQNLNYVITNLLTYARPMRLQISPVSIAAVFQLCRDTLEDRATRAQVDLHIMPPESDMQCQGDQRQIMQALLNLGINAIEACSQSDSVHISATESQDTITIRVQDSGCGMPPQQAAKVFDPFFTSKEGGTGLGLSLTRKIIDAHGGDINIKTNPGHGTLFRIEIPKTGVEA